MNWASLLDTVRSGVRSSVSASLTGESSVTGFTLSVDPSGPVRKLLTVTVTASGCPVLSRRSEESSASSAEVSAPAYVGEFRGDPPHTELIEAGGNGSGVSILAPLLTNIGVVGPASSGMLSGPACKPLSEFIMLVVCRETSTDKRLSGNSLDGLTGTRPVTLPEA